MLAVPNSSQDTPRVLIIEDSSSDAELILHALRSDGRGPHCQVVYTANDIETALASPDWDIVLSDYNVPGTGFSKILALNKACDPDRPIILISGSIGEEAAVALMRDGVADLILKSNMSRLPPAIARELNSACERYARREADDRFRSVIEVTGDWIWETDEEHRFTFFSEGISNANWLIPAANLGKTRWELFGAGPEDDRDWRQHKADLEARRPFRTFRITFEKDGRCHHLTTSGAPFFDRTGAWRGYRGMARDDTAIVEVSRRAEDAEALLKDAVDSISEGFVFFNSTDRMVLANDACRNLYPEIADVMVPGSRFEDIMWAAAERGVYPEAAGRESDWLRAKMAAHRDLSGNSMHSLKGGRWILVTERRMRNGGTAGLRMDITALKAAESERDFLAYHDAITRLPNQALFRDRLAQALAKVRPSEEALAVVSLELTSLADIRASQGLSAGKAAMIETGRRIEAALSAGDTVGHLGDGRYLAFSTEAGSDSTAISAVGRILATVKDDFRFNGVDMPLRVVLGASLAPADGTESNRLIRNATTALSEVKANPSQPYQFYSPAMSKAAVFRLEMESDIRRGIEKNEFLLHYQPQVDAQTFRITGAEALMRWAHPEHGFVSPGKFIPIAEETGLIVPLGELALRLACSEAKAWCHPTFAPFSIAVNVSAVQLSDARLKDTILSILEENELPPEMLKLELTESAILKNVEAASRTMHELAEMGIRFALDDFGIEHSTLSHLARLPIETLKLDYAFVSKMIEDNAYAALVQGIISMAHSLGMSAIAEGVERAEQVSSLQSYGCDQLQGFLFSRAIPVAALVERLACGVIRPGKTEAEISEKILSSA